MPELPEVETIARALCQGGRGGEALPGRTLQRVDLLWARCLAEPSLEEFLTRLPGQTVRDVGRRGKFLSIQLDRDTLLIHLRMSGDLRVEPSVSPEGTPLALQPHDRVVFYFTNGLRLAFNDARKFGRIWLVDDPTRVTGALGPEPFDPELTPALLHQRLGATRRQLKPLLLDQAFLAGVGNIYSDEALHLAHLHPLQPANRLTLAHSQDLLEAIRAVLQAGIDSHGASIDWVYRGGNFQNNFRVYQRTGKPCPVCQTPILRLVVGQRGTHYCPACQVLQD
jgi:formamidopyrimidine-DNA glycosylase